MGFVVWRRLRLVVAVVGLVGLGASVAFASNTFTDVDEGRYYTDAVGWAADNGVTTGTSATTFSPENAVTRAQNVTFAYRYDQNVVQPALNNIATDIAANNTDIAANAADIAALDTLDELSCTATQVAINDSGWRCADPVLKPSFRAATNQTLETTDDVGYYTSVAVGADGNPIISHYDATNDDLELYVCANPTCTTGTNQTLETTGNVGWYTSVAIGADGNPVISHWDGSNGDLELYVCANPACTTGTNQELETVGIVGWYTSVAIGVDGNPIISYYDSTNDDLELYVCANPTCTTGTNQTLETTGDVGRFTSVAIGADGNPIISHYDDTNADLELYVGPATTYTIAFE